MFQKEKKIRRINLQNIQDQSEVTFDNEKREKYFGESFKAQTEKNLYLQSSERILKLNKDNNKFITVFKKDRYIKDNNKLNKIQVFLPISEKHFLIGDDKLVIDKDDVITFVLTKENELPDGQIVSILPYRNTKDKKEPEGYWIGTSKGLVHYIEGKKPFYTIRMMDQLEIFVILIPVRLMKIMRIQERAKDFPLSRTILKLKMIKYLMFILLK